MFESVLIISFVVLQLILTVVVLMIGIMEDQDDNSDGTFASRIVVPASVDDLKDANIVQSIVSIMKIAPRIILMAMVLLVLQLSFLYLGYCGRQRFYCGVLYSKLLIVLIVLLMSSLRVDVISLSSLICFVPCGAFFTDVDFIDASILAMH